MYIRILKRHGRYVAEIVKSGFIEENLQPLCLKLAQMGVKKSMILGKEEDPNAFDFNEFEEGILRDFIPD